MYEDCSYYKGAVGRPHMKVTLTRARGKWIESV
jgi:hypothetical protein